MILTWLRGSSSIVATIIVALATILGTAGVWTAARSIKSAIVASRDLQWQHQLRRQQDAAADREARANKIAEEALQKARDARESLDAERSRVQSLEAALARLSDDPVIWNHEIVKELRK